MFLRLSRPGRSLYFVAGGAVFGALLAGAGPQIAATVGRPGCAETVMRAVSTDQTVPGTYQCFDENLQAGLLTIGVDSDSAFAQRIGQNGDYHFVHKTADGGYVYEYDRPTTPHDEVQGTISALGLPQMRADVRRGNFLAAWNEKHDVGLAWAEMTGETQNDQSRLFTIYIGQDGRVSAVK